MRATMIHQLARLLALLGTGLVLGACGRPLTATIVSAPSPSPSADSVCVAARTEYQITVTEPASTRPQHTAAEALQAARADNMRVVAAGESINAYFALLTKPYPVADHLLNTPVWIVEMSGLNEPWDNGPALPLGASPRPPVYLHHAWIALRDADLVEVVGMDCT